MKRALKAKPSHNKGVSSLFLLMVAASKGCSPRSPLLEAQSSPHPLKKEMTSGDRDRKSSEVSVLSQNCSAPLCAFRGMVVVSCDRMPYVYIFGA